MTTQEAVKEIKTLSWFPKGGELGDLTLEEMFIYYDGPRLFTARSANGNYYVALCIQEEAAGLTWLWALTTPDGLERLHEGGVPLREAFNTPGATVYRVITTLDPDRPDTVTLIDPASLTDDMLPVPTARLEGGFRR